MRRLAPRHFRSRLTTFRPGGSRSVSVSELAVLSLARRHLKCWRLLGKGRLLGPRSGHWLANSRMGSNRQKERRPNSSAMDQFNALSLFPFSRAIAKPVVIARSHPAKWSQNGKCDNASAQGTAMKINSDPQIVTRWILRRVR